MLTIISGVGLLLVTLAGFSLFSMKAPKGSEAMSGMANAAIASFLIEAVHSYITGDVYKRQVLLPVANGCPYNQCTFCSMYKDEKYQEMCIRDRLKAYTVSC